MMTGSLNFNAKVKFIHFSRLLDIEGFLEWVASFRI